MKNQRSARPTKLVCPGFGRTGTTSLAQALNILGWQTREIEGHWYLMRRETDRLIFDPDLRYTNRYDAFLDSPVPLVYRELLDLFPDSLLIITVRPIDDWLVSIERFEAMQQAAFEASTAECRAAATPLKELFEAYNRQAYGAPSFERRSYAESYERHYAELRAYVRAQAKPALEIDITNGEGWTPLCEWLGVPMPIAAFPRRNAFTRR